MLRSAIPLPSLRRFSMSMLFVSLTLIGGLVLQVSTCLAYTGSVPVPEETYTSSSIGGCQVFPSNNIWNYDISNLPVYARSSNYVAGIGATGQLHAYFGSTVPGYAPPGLPYTLVSGNQPKVPVTFIYAGESNPGPYPVPSNAPIEGGANSTLDRHVIVLDHSKCTLYEMWDAFPQSNGSWTAGSGAVWSLNSNDLRPADWTSADAAGLPVLPGLVRYDEVASGIITHALRFVVPQTQMAYLWPARHQASSSTDPNLPPMGLRFRLKASFDISSFSPEIQVILRALKHYGMFVADNGGTPLLDICGAPDSRWNNGHLAELGRVKATDLEAVDESSLQLSPDSGAVKPTVDVSPSTSVSSSSDVVSSSDQFIALLEEIIRQFLTMIVPEKYPARLQ